MKYSYKRIDTRTREGRKQLEKLLSEGWVESSKGQYTVILEKLI